MTNNDDDDATIALELKEKFSEINNSEQKESVNVFSVMQAYLKIKNQLLREFLAETLGIYILLTFGLASCAQNTFIKPESFLSVNITFGFAATIAGVITGKISGCHINPAVSFAFLITGQMKIVRFLVYTAGQLLGAFFAAFTVWVVYLDAINKDDDRNKTAGIFATYPNPNLSLFGGFFDQFIATSLLIVVVLAITDKNQSQIQNGTSNIIVGLTVTIIGTAFGYNCGYAINPARDLGPRFFTAIAGWGSYPFTAFNYFFWVPVVGPMAGAVFGVFVYSLFISNHWS